jgi:hypothetical protein
MELLNTLNQRRPTESKEKSNRKIVMIDGKQYIKDTKAGVLYKMQRVVYTRKIARNILKAKQGSNKIRNLWRSFQIKRYGFKVWLKKFLECRRRK